MLVKIDKLEMIMAVFAKKWQIFPLQNRRVKLWSIVKDGYIMETVALFLKFLVNDRRMN